MSHIFLIGFMGAGKSTVARLVAERTGRPFIDLDNLIEASEGCSVREIFENQGEAHFREVESAALASIPDRPPSIIACGGGVVLSDANRAELRRRGMVVYLRVSAGETLARVGADGTRPLLSGHGGALAATKLLDARESLYAAVADITIDTVGRTPGEVARTVTEAIETRSGR
jgi:shikimate kinase